MPHATRDHLGDPKMMRSRLATGGTASCTRQHQTHQGLCAAHGVRSPLQPHRRERPLPAPRELSSLIRCRPRELLADRAHHIVRNLGALEHRILSPQLPADRAARLPHRADDAIELWIGSLDDSL